MGVKVSRELELCTSGLLSSVGPLILGHGCVCSEIRSKGAIDSYTEVEAL